MRKRNKVHCAKSIHGVKSRKRKRNIMAAFNGIAKWGKCKNLMRTILKENNMSFKDFLPGSDTLRDKNGKRIFEVPEVKPPEIINRYDGKIIICDFEDNLTIQGKSGKCCVLYRGIGEQESLNKKFITSSTRIIGKLQKARELESEGEKIFPQPTKLTEVRIGNGRYTYDIE